MGVDSITAFSRVSCGFLRSYWLYAWFRCQRRKNLFLQYRVIMEIRDILPSSRVRVIVTQCKITRLMTSWYAVFWLACWILSIARTSGHCFCRGVLSCLIGWLGAEPFFSVSSRPDPRDKNHQAAITRDYFTSTTALTPHSLLLSCSESTILSIRTCLLLQHNTTYHLHSPITFSWFAANALALYPWPPLPYHSYSYNQ